jgi:hypothetical protein
LKTTTLVTASDLKHALEQAMDRFAEMVPTLPSTRDGKLELLIAAREFRKLARGLIELGFAGDGYEKSALALAAGVERMHGELTALEAAVFAEQGAGGAIDHVEFGRRLLALPSPKLSELVTARPDPHGSASFAELVQRFAFDLAAFEAPNVKRLLDQLKRLIQVILTILAKTGEGKFRPWLELIARSLDTINGAVRMGEAGATDAAHGDCAVQVLLVSLDHTGSNLGTDWTYEFGTTIDGAVQSPTVLNAKDVAALPRQIGGKVCQGRCGDPVPVHVNLAATEDDDFDANDVGSGQGDWETTCPGMATGTLSVTVRENNQSTSPNATTISAEILILWTCQHR